MAIPWQQQQPYLAPPVPAAPVPDARIQPVGALTPAAAAPGQSWLELLRKLLGGQAMPSAQEIMRLAQMGMAQPAAAAGSQLGSEQAGGGEQTGDQTGDQGGGGQQGEFGGSWQDAGQTLAHTTPAALAAPYGGIGASVAGSGQQQQQAGRSGTQTQAGAAARPMSPMSFLNSLGFQTGRH